MSKQISTNTVRKNVVISVAVQVISLLVSVVLNLIVPKFIDEHEYAFWQTYALYVGYVGVLHFGLLDGIVLRYSEYDYEELDKPKIRSQFQLLLLINTICALIIIAVSFTFGTENMRYITFFVAFGVITKNVYTYTSYTFQITNRISKYALLVISMRLFYGIMVIAMLLLRCNRFYYFCIADICSDLFGIAVGYLYNKGMYFGKSIPLHDSLAELRVNIQAGIMLMIANWSSGLIVNYAKMLIQWRWDNLLFGKVSFAFSLSNMFLTFVSAISVVLFPSLKRMEQDKLAQIYLNIRSAVSILLFSAMALFFPGCWILDIWLPKYHASLEYLGILLPIIIYTSKVSLLTNNYLKAYRKEKIMLIINVASVAVAFIVFTIMTYIFDNIIAILVSVVFMIMMRSVASEIVVMHIIKVRMVKDFMIEAVMTLLFIASAKLFDLWSGWAVYSIILIIYLFINKDSIRPYLKNFLNRRNKTV